MAERRPRNEQTTLTAEPAPSGVITPHHRHSDDDLPARIRILPLATRQRYREDASNNTHGKDE